MGSRLANAQNKMLAIEQSPEHAKDIIEMDQLLMQAISEGWGQGLFSALGGLAAFAGTGKIVGALAGAAVGSAAEGVVSRAAELWQKEHVRDYFAASGQFVNAVLRDESGSAINADEYQKEGRTYVARLGDGPSQLQYKSNARMQTIWLKRKQAGMPLMTPVPYTPPPITSLTPATPPVIVGVPSLASVPQSPVLPQSSPSSTVPPRTSFFPRTSTPAAEAVAKLRQARYTTKSNEGFANYLLSPEGTEVVRQLSQYPEYPLTAFSADARALVELRKSQLPGAQATDIQPAAESQPLGETITAQSAKTQLESIRRRATPADFQALVDRGEADLYLRSVGTLRDFPVFMRTTLHRRMQQLGLGPDGQPQSYGIKTVR